MSRRADGVRIERRIRWYLRFRGYRIQAANYYTPYGEIDIIASKNGALVFVEVRSKKEESASRYGTPAQSVTPQKQSRIIKSARFFLSQSFISCAEYRFDVIEVIKKKHGLSINHIKNAFYINHNNSH